MSATEQTKPQMFEVLEADVEWHEVIPITTRRFTNGKFRATISPQLVMAKKLPTDKVLTSVEGEAYAPDRAIANALRAYVNILDG